MANFKPRLLTPALPGRGGEGDVWWFHAPARGQVFRLTVVSNTFSWLGALGLEVHDRMAGLFLAFASYGKQPANAVSARGGQLVLGAPDFPQDKVALGRFNGLGLDCFQKFWKLAKLKPCITVAV